MNNNKIDLSEARDSITLLRNVRQLINDKVLGENEDLPEKFSIGDSFFTLLSELVGYNFYEIQALHRESFTSSSIKIRSLLRSLTSEQLTGVFGRPSVFPVTLLISKRSIMNFPRDTFTISKNSTFIVENTIPFSIINDIEFTKVTNSVTGDLVSLRAIRNFNRESKLSGIFPNIRQSLNVSSETFDIEGNGNFLEYFLIDFDLLQFSTQTEIINIGNRRIYEQKFPFDENLIDFDLLYRGENEISLNAPKRFLTDRHLFGEVPTSVSTQNSFSYWFESDPAGQNIGLLFPRFPDSFPEPRSELTINIYTCLGEAGNLTYTDIENDFNRIAPTIIPDLSNPDTLFPAPLEFFLIPQTTSGTTLEIRGGKNALTLNEIKNLIRDFDSPRNFIIDRNDLEIRARGLDLNFEELYSDLRGVGYIFYTTLIESFNQFNINLTTTTGSLIFDNPQHEKYSMGNLLKQVNIPNDRLGIETSEIFKVTPSLLFNSGKLTTSLFRPLRNISMNINDDTSENNILSIPAYKVNLEEQLTDFSGYLNKNFNRRTEKKWQNKEAITVNRIEGIDRNIFSGIVSPSTNQALSALNLIENDIYFDTITGNLYRYNSNIWGIHPQDGFITKSDSIKYRVGNVVPSESLGSNTDIYLNLVTGDIYEKFSEIRSLFPYTILLRLGSELTTRVYDTSISQSYISSLDEVESDSPIDNSIYNINISRLQVTRNPLSIINTNVYNFNFLTPFVDLVNVDGTALNANYELTFEIEIMDGSGEAAQQRVISITPELTMVPNTNELQITYSLPTNDYIDENNFLELVPSNSIFVDTFTAVLKIKDRTLGSSGQTRVFKFDDIKLHQDLTDVINPIPDISFGINDLSTPNNVPQNVILSPVPLIDWAFINAHNFFIIKNKIDVFIDKLRELKRQLPATISTQTGLNKTYGLSDFNYSVNNLDRIKLESSELSMKLLLIFEDAVENQTRILTLEERNMIKTQIKTLIVNYIEERKNGPLNLHNLIQHVIENTSSISSLQITDINGLNLSQIFRIEKELNSQQNSSLTIKSKAIDIPMERVTLPTNITIEDTARSYITFLNSVSFSPDIIIVD